MSAPASVSATGNAGIPCFALLDDCDASAAEPRSRLYSGHVATLSCARTDQFPELLARVQRALRAGQHAVVLLAYELGAGMHGIASRDAQNAPLAEVLLFASCEKLSADEVSLWLEQRAAYAPSGIADVRADTDEAQFHAALARIRDYIEAGDTYQVNYTYRLRFDAYGSPFDLYRRLRARQPVPYGALIVLPDGRAVLSLSPELFVRHEGGALTVRPMKGTAAADGEAQHDARTADALAGDAKNRAENLMIVDLLRNDLGRIAQTGSVQVQNLFDVQRYGGVLQMTSTVRAELRRDVSLPALFDALYPCGSITGAPKRRTMQIIRELETSPRGLYTGAIGWFDPTVQQDGIGDFCLSVPIRTLLLQAPDDAGNSDMRRGEMGVGAGVVHDSVAKHEYEECRLKAAFLTGMPSSFSLFETMHATRAEGCHHLERHLHRLRQSARYFGFSFDERGIRTVLTQACARLDDGPHRMRLALAHDGSIDLQNAPLQPLAMPVHVQLATQRTDGADLFLRHKTTQRARYDAAWHAAEQQGAFDQLFFNERGHLTEGGRSSVFVRLNGWWYTPPLRDGVLPGVMRAVLLDDPAWNAEERSITLTDLRRAEEIVVCSALRGVLPAVIDWPD
ncbi:MAG TPA: aminodeoxychorismate synthase component I [Oxalicibacterium sp.]|nr:aminodeoxychorismate synthase component I [Oxalicibacterium sp.]